jgi:ATP-dependent Clp protease ATP-binding subunit ClpB
LFLIFLLTNGLKYGARHLKRAIERHIGFPLADLVATRQVKLGDFIRIDRDSDGRINFVKEAEGALVPVLLERYGQEASSHIAAGTASKAHAAGWD